MLQALTTFAALSMAGTVILSLLPEGGVKRTAGMALGLLTLLCWAEGIASLLGITFPADGTETTLLPTTYSIESAADNATATLAERWDAAQ